jgi:cellulose synthase/poly-beta-1,6-N-acetylglucosamine synthase-like glycosyltransferase
MLTTLFLVCAASLAYTYAGYPALLLLARGWQRRRRIAAGDAPRPWLAARPSVSVLVAAHNEAAGIAARVRNLLAQHYPHDRLEILVGSDGSTDDTVAVVSGLGSPNVRVLDLPRQGRALVHNACAAVASGDILVFTDAGTHFDADCLRRLTHPFADAAVGCAGGHLVYTNSGEPGIAQSAGFYWRYELLLRRLESAVASTVAVTGACMAMRHSLFRPLAAVDDIDDAAPIDTLLQGYRVVYTGHALAYDRLPASAQSELAARERIVTKNLTAVLHRPRILSPVHYPVASVMLLSHRILRYLSPVFLLGLFFVNALLLDVAVLRMAWVAQLFFYAGAALGYAADRLHWRVPLLSTCFALCLANVGFLLGVLNIVRRRGVAHYEPIR